MTSGWECPFGRSAAETGPSPGRLFGSARRALRVEVNADLERFLGSRARHEEPLPGRSDRRVVEQRMAVDHRDVGDRSGLAIDGQAQFHIPKDPRAQCD
jgi:hypothetical protein